MAGMSASAVGATRTTGLNSCAGCRCFIHTAVSCDAVCAGEAEGEYWCGHCHALARLYDAPPPPLAPMMEIKTSPPTRTALKRPVAGWPPSGCQRETK